MDQSNRSKKESGTSCKILSFQLVQNVLQIKKQAMLFAMVALTTLEQDGFL